MKVLVVMGHEGCGAVKAARLPIEDLDTEPQALRSLLKGEEGSRCSRCINRDMRRCLARNERVDYIDKGGRTLCCAGLKANLNEEQLGATPPLSELSHPRGGGCRSCLSQLIIRGVVTD